MNSELNNELKNILEAVLLVSDAPVSIAKMQGLFEDNVQPPSEEIRRAIESLQRDCEDRGVELRKIGSGYRYQSKVKYADWVRKLYSTRPPKLSRALLETLAIIAYRQPVTRGDIEEIRGVSVSSDIIQKLQEREWVKQIGVRDLPGRPALFGTTPEFLSYFNLESLRELPSLMQERELGTIARELETPLPPEVLAALEKKQADDVFSGLPIDAVTDGATKIRTSNDAQNDQTDSPEVEPNDAVEQIDHLHPGEVDFDNETGFQEKDGETSLMQISEENSMKREEIIDNVVSEPELKGSIPEESEEMSNSSGVTQS